MAKALYGPSGFYRVQQPAEHFRTSVRATPVFSRAIARLLHAVDEALERPRSIDLVDVGAGSGELVAQVVDELDPAIQRRLNVTAVEIRPAPPEAAPEMRVVQVMTADGPVARLVRLGVTSRTNAEVREGLELGEEVVATPPAPPPPGNRPAGSTRR